MKYKLTVCLIFICGVATSGGASNSGEIEHNNAIQEDAQRRADEMAREAVRQIAPIIQEKVKAKLLIHRHEDTIIRP